MQTILKYKWIILGTLVIILVFVIYGAVKPDSSNAPGGIEETIVSIPGGDGSVTSSDEDPAAGFILQLLAIQNVNFNVDFFNDPVYKELVDQSSGLGERFVGRPNPFLDIGTDNIDPNAPVRKTGQDAPVQGGFVQTSPEETAQ